MAKTDKPETAKQNTASMVADHPMGNLRLVEDLARDAGVPGWERAALMHAAGWAPGKQVSRSEFDANLAKLRNRPTGGGRL